MSSDLNIHFVKFYKNLISNTMSANDNENQIQFSLIFCVKRSENLNIRPNRLHSTSGHVLGNQ